MAFGWCYDERPYPDEEIDGLRIRIAKLTDIGDKMAEFLEQLPGSSTREAWCVQTVEAWQEAKGEPSSPH